MANTLVPSEIICQAWKTSPAPAREAGAAVGPDACRVPAGAQVAASQHGLGRGIRRADEPVERARL